MSFSVNLQSSEEDGVSDMAELNIIPLVDVMLVLLIIFMVAAPMSIGGIKVDLPTTKAKGSAVSEDRIVLSISKRGEYFLNKAKIPAKGLSEKFKAIYEFREKKELFIRADTGVAYGNVVYAMGSAKVAGVKKLAMLTKRKTGRSRKNR
jgi:biopolymer transport protein TolR